MSLESEIISLVFSSEDRKPIQVKRSLVSGDYIADASIEDIKIDTLDHIDAVKKGMGFIVTKALLQTERHDHTKLEHLSDFLHDLQRNFKGDDLVGWWDIHLTERHHLNSKPPEDVNLIDVLEMLVDCCVAGSGRAGKDKVYDIEISPDLLQKALHNTQQLIMDNLEVKDE